MNKKLSLSCCIRCSCLLLMGMQPVMLSGQFVMPGVVSPSSQTISSGTAPAPLTATAPSGGTGDYPYVYTFQWQSSPNNNTWANIPGATSGSGYAPGTLTATTYYHLLVYENGSAYVSNTATVTVVSLQAGTVSPASVAVNHNTSPGQLSGTAASGGNGTYAYQWQSSPTNNTWSNIGGAASQHYTPGNLTATTYFRRSVTSNGVTVHSNVATVTVYPPLTAGTLSPASISINYNTGPGQLSGTAATGGNGTYAYQWQSAPDNTTWSNIASATAVNYTPGPLIVTTYFRRSVTSNGITTYSNTATVTVYAPLLAGHLPPGSKSIMPGTSPGALGGATASGGSGSYTYQWQHSSDNSAWTNIGGATAQQYTPGNLSAATWYRRQVSSNGVTVFSEPIVIAMTQPVAGLPAAYSNTTNLNYIRTYAATAPDTGEVSLAGRPLKDVKQTTQYFDGLGRAVQAVVKQGSLATGSNPVDLVSPIIYDAYGREEYQYLSFAANGTGGNTSINDGAFKSNPFQQQASFMNAQYPGETYYYNKTVYEASPLNRVQKRMAVGNNWAGSNRGVEYKYAVNTVADSVRTWTVTNSGAIGVFGSYNGDSLYKAGELYKNITIDEHCKQVIEFTDREGKVILKKVQHTAAPDTGMGRGHYGWYCTYYLYDRYGLLRCVIQPKGVELLQTNSWSLTWNSSVILNEQCFRYEYDGKRRLQMKKVPGAGAVYMVYDARDRVVLTQDANMRTGTVKWLYTVYDSINRPVTTGLWTNNSGLSTHYSAAYASTVYPNLSGQTIEELTNTFYDNYIWRGSYGNPLSATRSTTYDTYLQSPSNAVFPYPQNATVQSSALKGLVTGLRTKVPGTATYLYAVNFYDDKGRLIQVQSTNLANGTDIQTTQYTFAGQPVIVVGKTEKAGTNAQTIVTVSQYSYDDLGRLAKIEKKLSHTLVNGNAMSPYKTVAEMHYDALGQLRKKILSPTGGAGGSPLDSLVYGYNIRGWLLGMNRSYTKDTNSTSNYFGFELAYDNTGLQVNGTASTYANAYFNGNIAGMLWKGGGDSRVRRYDLTYDAVNRLTDAHFKQFTGNSFNLNAGMDFSCYGLGYDANGNILTLNQKGWRLSGSTMVDNLVYAYHNNGSSNRLLNVIDGVNDAQTRLGDFRTSSLHPNAGSKTSSTVDFSYDDNGNMIKDLNKDLVTFGGGNGIEYNYLNLPARVTIKKDGSSNKGIVEYVYDAAGNKLRKTVYEPGVDTTVTLYLNGAVYQDDTLQFIGQEEGRIRFEKADGGVCTPKPNRFLFDYFLKDHLGSVRMVLTEQKDTICYPAATVENARYQREDDYYNIENGRRVDKALTGATQGSFESRLYRVHGGLAGEKTGLGIVLKVMAGDKVKIMAESFYTMPGGGPGSPLTMALTDLLASMTGSAVLAHKGPLSAADIGGIGTNNVDLGQFLANNPPPSNTVRSFLTYLAFDEQLRFVGGGVEPVQAGGGYKIHSLFINSPISISKSGYIYVFVSNESNLPVYFDNLSVTHIPGPLIEENHYYPFGLTMTGISSRALTSQQRNTYKFNGKEEQRQELSDGRGLDWTDYGARMYDAQLGRWHCLDNLSEKFISLTPYNYCGNNPISNIDLDGNEFTDAAWSWVNRLINRINEREETISKSLAEAKAALANGGKAKRLNRQIKRLESENAELEATRFEVGILKGSDQKYNVVMSDEYNEPGVVPGTGTDAAVTRFNFSSGTVEMVMNDGASIGSFAHELKHAYQFEMGEISFGPKLTDEKVYTNFLYDKHDEAAGYKRGFLFGSGLPHNVNDLPEHYKDYPIGPVDAKTHPNLGPVILNMPIEKQKKHLQSVAKGTGHAFRINGITYYIPTTQ